MAKKAAKKKATGKKKASVAVKAGKGEPIKVDAVPMDETEVVIEDLKEYGITAFDNPYDLPFYELEDKAKGLLKSRNQDEVELCAVFHAIDDRRLYIDHGYKDLKEYCERALQASHTKAREMVTNWQLLSELGVADAKLLAGLSWEKIKVLKEGIKERVITKKNIKSWLKKCALTGKNALMRPDLVSEVKDFVNKNAKDNLDQKRKNVTFPVEAYEMETVKNFEELAKAALGTEDKGKGYLQAIIEWSSNHIDPTDAKAASLIHLANLKEFAERVAPVACIFIPLVDMTKGKKMPSVPLVYKVYQGFTDEGDGVRELKYCLAVSAQEAKKHLKVKEIKEFPLQLTNSLMPKDPFKSPYGEPEEVEEEKPKKAKEKPKKQPWETDNKTILNKIRELIKKLKISKDEYDKRKVKLKKALEKSEEKLTLSQAIYRWLLEEKDKRS